MITTLYAGLLAILYIALAACVIRGRYKYRIGLGDGGNEDMVRRIRIHGNFAEYVPFALLLLFLVDDAQTSPVIVHILGLMLLIGRLLHAWGVSSSSGVSKGRFIGMVLTMVMIIVCAVILLWKFFALRVFGF